MVCIEGVQSRNQAVEQGIELRSLPEVEALEEDIEKLNRASCIAQAKSSQGESENSSAQRSCTERCGGHEEDEP